MKTTQNTVLITGGSAGIGLAIAKALLLKGNHVIITGRNSARLEKALTELENVGGKGNITAVSADVTREEDRDRLAATIRKDYPRLNILINNAGQAYVHNLLNDSGASHKATEEMHTNFLGVIDLTEKLLPLLTLQPSAAIVNVTSVVAIAPGHRLPTYAASKAALHSYTQSLRITLEKTPVLVFELMPPLVDTELSAPIGGHNGIPPQTVADGLLDALEKDEFEIHVGQTADLFQLFRSSPAAALEAMNKR